VKYGRDLLVTKQQGNRFAAYERAETSWCCCCCCYRLSQGRHRFGRSHSNMGGGLGFLNKKTWHPGRMDNQEKVWKKEEERAKEQSKLEDIRKQIADERQKEELEMIAAAAGHKV